MTERDHDFEYVNDLRILKRFVQAGRFGYKEFDDEVFRRLSNRYPEAYAAFGEERKQDVLEKNKYSPYIEGQKETYPNNPDKPHYITRLERLRHLMILSKLGYGSREMSMALIELQEDVPRGRCRFRGGDRNMMFQPRRFEASKFLSIYPLRSLFRTSNFLRSES